MPSNMSAKKQARKKFLKDNYYQEYVQPKMVHAAEDMLNRENLTEEGFLGAQAVLFLNGLI